MRFRRAVHATPEIAHAFCVGLQALRSADQTRIQADDSSRILGSVDLDGTLKDKYPQDSRWDYAIAYQLSKAPNVGERVYWVEIHPANDGEVKAVLAKLDWLKRWLASHGHRLNELPREFVWLSSGKTTLTMSARQRKQLALAGVQHRGRILRLSDT